MRIRGRDAGQADDDEDVRRQLTSSLGGKSHCALCQNSNDFALSKLKFQEDEMNIVLCKWNMLQYY